MTGHPRWSPVDRRVPFDLAPDRRVVVPATALAARAASHTDKRFHDRDGDRLVPACGDPGRDGALVPVHAALNRGLEPCPVCFPGLEVGDRA